MVPYIEEECSYCFGTGEDDFDEMGRCSLCSGTGVIRTYFDEEDEEDYLFSNSEEK